MALRNRELHARTGRNDDDDETFMFMALWRRHLTGWQPVHQCCFPSLPGCLLWSVDLYDAIYCRIVSILRLSECIIKNIIIILQSERQMRTK